MFWHMKINAEVYPRSGHVRLTNAENGQTCMSGGMIINAKNKKGEDLMRDVQDMLPIGGELVTLFLIYERWTGD